jgi:hypothetical protein
MESKTYYTVKPNKKLLAFALVLSIISILFVLYLKFYEGENNVWGILSFIPSLSVILFQDRGRFWLSDQGIFSKNFFVKPKCIAYPRIYKVVKTKQNIPKAWLVEKQPAYSLEIYYDSFHSVVVLAAEIEQFENELKSHLQAQGLDEKIKWLKRKDFVGSKYHNTSVNS